MTEALHLQSGSEDRSTKLQMTAEVEIYVRVFRLPLFCLIFTGIASGLDKQGAYFFWYFIFIHHQIVQCVLLCSRNKSDVRLLQDALHASDEVCSVLVSSWLDNHVQIATTCFSPFHFPGSYLTNQI